MPRPSPAHLIAGAVAAIAILAASGAGIVLGQADTTPNPRDAAADLPLGAAMSRAYFGDTGVVDRANSILQPAETHMDVEVKAAHDGEQIYFQYTFATTQPSLFHGVTVYRDGSWVRLGQPPVRGPEASGLYEDKLAMLIDDGSVQGFANQGGWVTCHEDVRGMYSAAPGPDVQAHPVFGDLRRITSLPKYISQSRETGPGWWEFPGWDALSLDAVDDINQRRDSGVFLDLWLWGSQRSNPVGYADNEYVFDYRQVGSGTGPARANWNAQAQQPSMMFDPEVTGFAALDWNTLEAKGYGYEDAIFLIDGHNVVPFDPDREWREGDAIPSVVLNPEPTQARGMVRADGQLVTRPDGSLAWQVTLWRAMDGGGEVGSKDFRVGRTYDVAVAVHRYATGSRWHYVSLPFTVGIDTPADVTARRFDGEQPDWSRVDGSTRTLVYPGQTNWQWLTSDAHPGGVQVRNDSMSVVGCHDEIGLGAANKDIETYLAGLTPFSPPELTVSRPGIEPGNIVLWFVVAAVAILVIAVALGRLRRG